MRLRSITLAALLLAIPRRASAQTARSIAPDGATRVERSRARWQRAAPSASWEATVRAGRWIDAMEPRQRVLFAGGRAERDSGFGGGASLTYFTSPVVDDGTPVVLRPYLQRASSITLRSRFDVALHSQTFASYHLVSADRFWQIGVSGDFYVSRSIAMHVGMTHQRGELLFGDPHGPLLTSSDTLVETGIALRLGDTQIGIDYRLRLWIPVPPYGVSLNFRRVVARRIDLKAEIRVIGGVVASTSAGFSVTRDLTVSLAAIAGYAYGYYGDIPILFTDHGAVPSGTAYPYAVYGGGIGLCYWLDPHIGIAVNYSLWAPVFIRHDASLAISLRL